MSTPRRDDPTETRAEVARRRLAELNASFQAAADDPAPQRWSPRLADDHDRLDDDGPVPRPPVAPRGGHRAAAPRRRPGLEGVHLRIVAAGAVAAGVVLTWWLLAERPRVAEVGDSLDVTSQVAATRTPGEEPAPEQAAAPGVVEGGEVVVDVAGKVERPGIVTLPQGSRVHEAIEEAGGLRGKVDTTTLNLARVLVDGEQVLVGVEPATVPGPTTSGAGAGAGGGPGATVNLNTATSEELQTLPGVGPVTAEAILAWRTENGRFGTVEDLLDVTGIGDKTLADLRDRVSV